MNDRPLIDIDDLLDEIGRYLAAVEVFRAVDCEPSWRPEWPRENDLVVDEKTTAAQIAR